jgi:hypothetical protein
MTDLERVKLLYGPYQAPPLRRGDRATAAESGRGRCECPGTANLCLLIIVSSSYHFSLATMLHDRAVPAPRRARTHSGTVFPHRDVRE